jgi:hypothetical protein
MTQIMRQPGSSASKVSFRLTTPISLLTDRITYQHISPTHFVLDASQYSSVQHFFFLSLSLIPIPKLLCLRWNCPAPLLPALAHRRRRSRPSQTLSIWCLLSLGPLFPGMRVHIGDKEKGTQGRAGARCVTARLPSPYWVAANLPHSLPRSPCRLGR